MTVAPEKEWKQSHEDRQQLDEHTSASCAPAARPRARATGGIRAIASANAAQPPLAPDSRDEATGERLDDLEDPFGSTAATDRELRKACPKGLNPAKRSPDQQMLIERQV